MGPGKNLPRSPPPPDQKNGPQGWGPNSSQSGSEEVQVLTPLEGVNSNVKIFNVFHIKWAITMKIMSPMIINNSPRLKRPGLAPW